MRERMKIKDEREREIETGCLQLLCLFPCKFRLILCIFLSGISLSLSLSQYLPWENVPAGFKNSILSAFHGLSEMPTLMFELFLLLYFPIPWSMGIFLPLSSSSFVFVCALSSMAVELWKWVTFWWVFEEGSWGLFIKIEVITFSKWLWLFW